MAFHIEIQGARCGQCAPLLRAIRQTAIVPQASHQDFVITSDA
jgi:hypothetical protein